MVDVFVSYKAEDRRRVQPLVSALKASGLSVWWDTQIGGGDHWRDTIEQQLEEAKCVIVVWSKRSVGREGHFVRDEAARAQRRGVYLPISVDRVEPPLGFGEVQAVPLIGWKGDRSDARYEAVLAATQAIVSGQPRPCHVHAVEHVISRRTAIAGGAAMMGVAGVGGWLLLKPTPANGKRIAVMPFANLSGDPAQAYFSDGIAEELRAALSRIGMEVIGRTSSDAARDLDAKAAAVRLGVANILTGSVRRSATTIRIRAQLVNGKDGVERWAQSYDRLPGDAIKIQTDIAANVAQALSITLGQAGRSAITLGGTSDSVAQDLLLQGRQWFRDTSSEEGSRKALTLAEAAIVRDPNYADAFVMKALALDVLAGSYSSNVREVVDGEKLAYAAARRALEIAPGLGLAQAAIAAVETSRLNFRESNEHARKALALSPADPEVLVIVGRIIAWLADAGEGLQIANRFLSLDPLNSRGHRRKAEILLALRRYGEAISTGRRALQLSPNAFSARITTGDSLVLLGRYAEALIEYRSMPEEDVYRLKGEALVAARTGDVTEVQSLIARMRSLFGDTPAYQYAEVFSQLNQPDRAFEELAVALSAKDPGLPYLRTDPLLDPVRQDGRFRQVLDRLNFPN